MPKIKIIELLLTIFLILSAVGSGNAGTAGSGVLSGDNVTIIYDDGLLPVASEVMRIYPSVRAELETAIGSEMNLRPTVRLMRNRKSFQDIAGRGPVVAIAINGDDLIIIDNSQMKTRPFSLRVTLKHEVCHLFLHEYVGAGTLPRWLNEGICQNVSDGIAEVIVGERKNLLKQAVLTDRYLSIHELEKKFPSEPNDLLLAYEQSKSFVEYIENKYGSDGIIRILGELREGKDTRSAVAGALVTSLYKLERDWKEDLKKHITWFTYFSNHIYPVLFTMAALVMVVGYVRFLIKKRNYRDEDDEGDQVDSENE